MQPETPSHFRFEPSFSLKSKSTAHRPQSLTFRDTESSLVAFHQTPLGMNTADTEMASVNVSPRDSVNHGQSMPIEMKWPLHPHPLTYAGTVTNDGSVTICTCRNCGQEHYNSAVYSCVSQSRCVYHVCLACAMEQQSASHKKEIVESPITPKKPVNENINHNANQSKRRARMNSTPSSPTSPRNWIAPGALSFSIGLIAPINCDPVKLKKEPFQLRRWATAVQSDASSFSMRLALPCAFHPDHTLYFYPTCPSLGSKVAPHTLHNRLFCDASQSELCASYELNKHERPFYACSDCNYRLCMPCYRIYMMDLRQQVNVPKRALDEVQHSIEQSRAIDHTAAAYSELILRNLVHLNTDASDCIVLAGVGTVYSLVLINAMITQFATGSYAAPLLNCVILSIMSVVPSLLGRHFIRLSLDYHSQLVVHSRTIESLYSDSALHVVSDGFEPATIAVSALKPRERELVNNLYHHTASFLRKQSRAVKMAACSLLFKMCSIALLIASIVYLFVSVICALPAYNEGVGNCEARSGIPIGLGLFMALAYPLVWRLVEAAIAASFRNADMVIGRTKENKRASKRARLDYV